MINYLAPVQQLREGRNMVAICGDTVRYTWPVQERPEAETAHTGIIGHC